MRIGSQSQREAFLVPSSPSRVCVFCLASSTYFMRKPRIFSHYGYMHVHCFSLSVRVTRSLTQSSPSTYSDLCPFFWHANEGSFFHFFAFFAAISTPGRLFSSPFASGINNLWRGRKISLNRRCSFCFFAAAAEWKRK